MAAARAFLRMRARQPGTLGEIVGELNRRLNADVSDSWRFMTLFLLSIDAGRLAWVSAGHDPALLIDPATGTIEELSGGGPPVGLFPEEKYEDRNSVILQLDQVLVLATDGIPETFGPDGQQYGQERFRASLLRHTHQDSQAMLDAVLADMLQFRGEAPQTDDITIVVVRRTT
jgi:sigma-B regulation protein RsbU (phosphoserine phosphatase)